MNELPLSEEGSVQRRSRWYNHLHLKTQKNPKYLEHIAAPQLGSQLFSRSHNSTHSSETIEISEQHLSLDSVFQLWEQQRLPGSPVALPDWALAFGATGPRWRTHGRQLHLVQADRSWRLQEGEVLHQSGLSLQPLPGQEVAHLLDTSGIALFHSCRAHGPVLLLQLPEDADCHLQDIGFLHLGVRLLVEELWTQQRLELLNAAVDSLPA